MVLYLYMCLFVFMEHPSLSQPSSTFAINCFWQIVNMFSDFAELVVVDLEPRQRVLLQLAATDRLLFDRAAVDRLRRVGGPRQGGDEGEQKQIADDARRCELLVGRLKQLRGASTAFTQAMDDVFLVAVPFLAVALVIAFTMREKPLAGREPAAPAAPGGSSVSEHPEGRAAIDADADEPRPRRAAEATAG